MQRPFASYRVSFLFVVLLACGLCGRAGAKSLGDRIGIGVARQNFESTTAVSMRYFTDNEVSFGLVFGFDSFGDTSHTLVGGRASRMLLLEENLNLYGAIQGLIVSKKPGGGAASATGLEISPAIGAEFFLPGLPNLGLSFEVGLMLRTLGGTRFATTGNPLAEGAIHYYF